MIGRLAPSPTGAQHVGNARTFLMAWWSIQSRSGQTILRMEDIDSPRIKPWAATQALDDLRWLGLNWDAGPDIGGAHAPYTQTQRLPLYEQALQRLKEANLVYPCTCSRTDIEAAASAPHVGQEGPVYPGTCSHRTPDDAAHLSGQPYCWRFRMSEPETFVDRVFGEQSIAAGALGDFVVCKSDGTPAYQLAVVVDDHAMGITEVVRGADLLPSTFRQRALYRVFGWEPPEFAHVPLVIGPDGRRLAKRHGDSRLSVLREAGLSSERLVGFLAWSCGLQPAPQPARASDLISQFDWARLSKEPLVFTPDDWQRIAAR